MKEEIYKFEEIRCADSSYILQLTSGRPLSRIGHSHDFYEIVLVTDGFIAQKINDGDTLMKKGDCLLLHPSEYHRITDTSRGACVICLSVKVEEFELVANAFCAEALCDYSPNASPTLTYIGEDFELCLSECRRGLGKSCETFCKRLLGVLISNFISRDDNAHKRIPTRLSAAMSQMETEENMREGLPALLRLSGYSHTHASRLMKNALGISVHEYILELRLSEARRRITSTDLSLEEVAESVGYESFSHFCKIFKERFGITPAHLRKSHSFMTV